MAGFGLGAYSFAGNVRRELLRDGLEPFLCGRHVGRIVEPALRRGVCIACVKSYKRRIAPFEQIYIVHGI